MQYHYDVTIIVPGIRNKKWSLLYRDIQKACTRFSFEVIFSGPVPLPSILQREKHIKYIKNCGSPTRALHLATLISEGRFFTWLSDDAHVCPNSIDKALDLLLCNKPEKDIICMRYTEGECYSGMEQPSSYWTAGSHAELLSPGVNPYWRAPGVMLLALSRYRELGGLDHAFEHLNMNMHDLAFRAQKDGSTVHLSPTQIMNCDWDSTRTRENSPIVAAFFDNDRPLFRKIYQDDSRPIVIDLENWRSSSPIWERRYNFSGRRNRWMKEILQKLVRRAKAKAKIIIRGIPSR